ncbi:MAG TPA: 1-deoxy-D-xylulose-5-phosphate reductoisomerase [Chloroflexota bacterium]|jgi:1-deoxy-D-xylulose-5-phosphate reductoisomerase|nr:1-deoxy-D-xylulose-5-phosphate reductoisomerase [Chloroflexota bacterium]
MTRRGLVVLGSTGSIGTQTLDVVRAMPGRFRVVGLAGGANVELLGQQIAEFDVPSYCASAPAPTGSARLVPMEELVSLPGVDLVVVATASTAALSATLKALELGRAVATANKEVLVAAGEIVVATARRHGAALLPIDSEHSAIWQCLRGEENHAVARVVLTASGGAFRDLPLDQLETVSPAAALKHPVWQMGAKITIDAATLVNKAFEVVEAHWLFDVPYDKIDVVIHRESVIHSVVHFVDGSSKAQLGRPDMHVPIQYALTYPERVENAVPPADLTALGQLSFAALDHERYPAFGCVLEAARRGGTYPAALSAANDVAVGLFLAGRTGFGAIAAALRACLDAHRSAGHPTLDDVLAAEGWARAFTTELLAGGPATTAPRA